MRNRVDKLGVSEPEIRKQGSNQIVIQLPAVHDVDEAAAIIGQTAQLELYDLETSLPPVGAARGVPIPTRGSTTCSPCRRRRRPARRTPTTCSPTTSSSPARSARRT